MPVILPVSGIFIKTPNSSKFVQYCLSRLILPVMCGISVAVNMMGPYADPTSTSDPTEKFPFEDLSSALGKSLDCIQHRGPDGRGEWISDDGKIGV